jgi:hypothetical protein
VIELSRYVFETLRQDEEFVLQRGQSDRDLSTILVVASASDHPIPAILERLEHEYSLRGELDSDWAARPLTLVRREDRLVLILEDVGSEPMRQTASQRYSGLLRIGIMNNQDITVNQVADICGNHEARLSKVAKEI